ncbi:LysR family transcriptional regulator [Pararoseomonas indoligenes]|uniref:LysR family transcriptional regulator n=1 Tax=Roseomonas indoligenes TaxID=2820811 RepID=A0A940S9D7_9PROT|nr:LysR family transcriptional regulator [Pararoseomonas indoligenes]MBP0495042.1 LysR family transcriptional regulator [Pararoseomonas indoligenes]
MLQHLRFRQLEMVRLLLETGSVRAAARAMNMTPPALSKSLREVEAIVGAVLFERTARGIVATAAGHDFVRHARVLLQGLEELRDCGRAVGGRARPVLRVGAAPFINWRIMPGVLRQLAQADERPRIQLIEGRIIPLADQLVNGELDAILTLFTPEALQVLEQDALVLDQIYAERMLVVAGPDHSLGGGEVGWARLAEEDWILPPPTFSQRLIVQRGCLEAGVLPPEPAIETSNIPAMLRMVMAGLGLAVTFGSTVREDLAEGRLQLVRTDGELPPVPIGLASRRTRADPRPLQALREAIRAYAAR